MESLSAHKSHIKVKQCTQTSAGAYCSNSDKTYGHNKEYQMTNLVWFLLTGALYIVNVQKTKYSLLLWNFIIRFFILCMHCSDVVWYSTVEADILLL